MPDKIYVPTECHLCNGEPQDPTKWTCSKCLRRLVIPEPILCKIRRKAEAAEEAFFRRCRNLGAYHTREEGLSYPGKRVFERNIEVAL